MSFAPTTEQQAILDAARASDTSLMIEAMAGCAKTTTLKMLSKHLPIRPSLALAFNKKIAVDLEKDFPGHFAVKTMNGLGHAAWMRVLGKRVSVDPDKIGKLLKVVLKDLGQQQTDSDNFSLILNLVRKARSSGLVPQKFAERATVLMDDTAANWQLLADSTYSDIDSLHIEVARELLIRCINLSYLGEIDFDDQIYMSTLFGGIYPKFPLVMVDEAQDLSPLNHLQLAKVAAGRLIVCGDPRQAIYAFRGADSESMSNLRQMRAAWVDLPLSLTFRCPRAVVARQQTHAPGFTAASSNSEGTIIDWASASHEHGEGRPWGIAEVEAFAPGAVAILCRNNAPLFAAALRIIKTGRGVTLMGSEISKGLISLVRKLFKDPTTPIPTAIEVITDWMEGEISKARANQQEAKVAIIRDKAECLLAICDNGDIETAGEIIITLTRMFQQGSLRIVLATGHKAKGLEWPVVVHLDPHRVPSKFALSAAQRGEMGPLTQDYNLKYVIETRAQSHLIMANLDKFEEAE